MQQPTLPPSVFTFLKKIKKNNNRAWFNANKEEYIKQHEAVIHFAGCFNCQDEQV